MVPNQERWTRQISKANAFTSKTQVLVLSMVRLLLKSTSEGSDGLRHATTATLEVSWDSLERIPSANFFS